MAHAFRLAVSGSPKGLRYGGIVAQAFRPASALSVPAAALVLTTAFLLAAAPTDPFYPQQWHLKNTGQGGGTAGEDVNIEQVWDTYLGSANEVIAVVDDGLEIAHEDLAQNVVAGLSFNYVNATTDPTPASGSDGHGTSAAGVAAARGFNGVGVSGAAPLAGLAGLNYLAMPTGANEADALGRDSGTIDIYSNSWGPADGGSGLDPLAALTATTMADRVANGRGGRGSIYVWAAGNGGTNDNANYDGYANSRYAIAVSATTNTGVRASYSEEGANILVNAPSNGGSLGIMTTDLTGSGGYNPGTAGSGGGSNPAGSTNYTALFGGTSSATPLVSGVVALMLQANPNLGWRDVRAILATTAEKNHPTDSDWTTNGAGYHVNHKYGFGRIDALAAVSTAQTWTNLGTEATAQGTASPGLPIPDTTATGTLGTPVSSTITIADDMTVEFAEVTFSAADHTYWADLQIELTSPMGTASVLARPHSAGAAGPLATRYNNWRFGTARHYGETSAGAWTLTVRDGGRVDVGTFQSWTLKLYGVSVTPTRLLTTSVAGSGSISSGPSGISCGTDCTERYTDGTSVTLTPSPAAGWSFAGWSGSADCYDGRVTMTQDLACTATFQQIAGTPSARAVDLTGDRAGDVFFYNTTTGAWMLAFSDRAGAFGFVAGNWDPQWVIVPAKLDTDTLTDFFLYNTASGVWVQARTNGAGGFTYTNGTFSPGWLVRSGRLNADAIDDIFVYDTTTGLAFQCWVDGAGGFSAFYSQTLAPADQVLLGALDADAFTDVFLYNTASGAWGRAMNTGTGSFTVTAGTWSPGWSATLGDFSGDGVDDVFLYNSTSGQWFQCFNAGGGFTYHTEFWSPGWQVFRGRLNADARDDIFLYNPVTGIWFQCFSDGTGGFSRYVTDVAWSPGWTAGLTDLDADGLDDVVLYNATTAQYFQALTSASGNFSRYTNAFISAGFSIVAQR